MFIIIIIIGPIELYRRDVGIPEMLKTRSSVQQIFVRAWDPVYTNAHIDISTFANHLVNKSRLTPLGILVYSQFRMIDDVVMHIFT
jgi:hypothetical protein